MSRIGFGAVVAAVLALSAPSCLADGFALESPSSLAQRASAIMPSPSSVYLAPMSAKEAQALGMAAAPALIKASGVDCELADARFIGESVVHKTKSRFYEVACTGTEGFVLAQSSSPVAAAYSCMEEAALDAHGKPGALRCTLRGNADPTAGIAPYVAKGGKPCAVDKIRAIGHSEANAAFEVACREGPGYILLTASPPRLDRDLELDPCIAFAAGGSVECKLTTHAAELAALDRLAGRSGKGCSVKDGAYVGASPNDRSSFYEVACTDGRGFVLEQAADGSLKATTDCALADYITGGGCKLTDSRQARVQAAAEYTRLAKSAGYDCDVSAYASMPGTSDGRQVVELACANRPAGGIGLFPAAGRGKVIDCAYARLAGYRCTLSTEVAAYATLTADLKALDKIACTVSNARPVGVSADRHGYIEVACAGGGPGYMIDSALATMTPVSIVSCAQAKGIGHGCILPGNTAR